MATTSDPAVVASSDPAVQLVDLESQEKKHSVLQQMGETVPQKQQPAVVDSSDPAVQLVDLGSQEKKHSVQQLMGETVPQKQQPATAGAKEGEDEKKKHPLQQLEESVALRKRLEQWEKEEERSRLRADSKDTRRSNTQNEVYQLFGLYFVFQGVVLSALYQARSGNNSTALCGLWWLPFTLSCITSVSAIVATLHKLHDQGKLEYAVEAEKEDARALFSLLEDMRVQGAQFNIDSVPQKTSKCPERPDFFACIFHPHLRYYTIFVTLVLCLFSSIILLACNFVLCHG